MKAAAERKRQRGVALLLVLIALTILGTMTADLMETNEVYLATAVNMRDATQAEYLARSGVNLSRLFLSFQKILGQQMNFPIWQYADLVIEMFADPEGGGMLAELAGADLSAAEGLGLGIPDSDLKVTIIDEDSKLNVNVANDRERGARDRMIRALAALVSPMRYDPLFDRSDEGGEFIEREEVICEMVDWQDPDEDLCDMTGSEDRSVYQQLEPPYERRNAPFDSLEELHFVRGIDDDFWSAFVDPDPEDPNKRIMTVWGKGKINVNTASPQALYMLTCMLASSQDGTINPCFDPMQRMNILAILDWISTFRTFMPFSKPRDFIAALENPQEKIFMPLPGIVLDRTGKRDARRLLTTRSTVFSIVAEGAVGRVNKRIHVVVDPEAQDVLNPVESLNAAGGRVLYWRME